MTEFVPFPKMPRLNRDIVITEKLDGTNAQVCITDDGQVLAGSRNRWITPESDNFGFAKWVEENKEELMRLGPGSHFGEWYGKGIQRGYGLEEKRFALFNTFRWSDADKRPACCHVVPVLYMGPFDQGMINVVLDDISTLGSKAVRGYMNPEGIVIYHTAANHCFKVTCKDDEKPKGQ